MKKLIQIGRLLFIGAIIGFNVAKAQGTGDSIVQITADAQGLSLISPDQLPPIGTYWMITPGGGPNGCVQAPLPIPPSGGLPVYQVADGEFIVDGTVGETVNETMLEAQANAIVNLINQIQGTQGIGMRAMDDSDPLFPGGSGGSYGYPTNSYVFSINTNLLWLQITNVSGGLAYLNLGSATDSVYGVYATPDLTQPFTNWLPVTELWPTNQTTNIYPFSVNADMATNQFYRALDWGNANGGYYLVNGLPAWWMYQWFGNLDETAGDLDYANNLLPLGYDYTNGIVPEVVRFSVLFPDQAAQASPVSGQVGLWEGLPVAMAVLVNDTNTADAVWQPYATNIVVNLTAGNGLYTVLVGLRGFAARTAVWQQSVLTLNTAPPVLTVTNPVANLVSQPMIQIQGYANKGLSQLNYAVSNAAGIFSGQGLVTGQFYDTNLLACSTNYFQCFDVPLTNGLNLVTLQALDLAGNVTTNQFNYTLDYSGDTTPPGLAVVWPTNGAYVSATNFTVQAAIDDDTATVVASITDSYGGSNLVAGVVERDGTVWVQNLPLNTGANSLTLTATDAASNVSTTNLTINQSGVQVTVAALPPDQLGLYSVTVTGTVSDPTARVYVNGVPAVVNDDGTWEADGVPVAAAGTALLDVLVYPAQVSSGGGGGGGASVVRSAISFSYDTNNLPTDTNSLGENVAALFQPPAVVTVEYHKRQTSAGLDADPPDYWFYSIGTSTVDWQDGVGGLAVAAGEETYYEYWPYSPYAYTSPYGGTETLLPVADYPMERGFVPGGTVDAQTALKTGGEYQPGQENLYLVQFQVNDAPAGAVYTNYADPSTVWVGSQQLVADASDSTWGDLLVQAPSQATVQMTPTTAANHYTAIGRVEPITLQIMDANTGTNLSAQTNTVIVGRQMNLTCQLSITNSPMTNVLTNFQWTIPGYAISNYVVAPDTSSAMVITNFPLNNSNVVYYWVDGTSNRVVKCSATVNGMPVMGQATFNVLKPAAQITSQTATVGVNIIGANQWLVLVGPAQEAGITFTNTISLFTNFPGSVEWVQVDFSPSPKLLDTNSIWHTNVQSGPGPYLDTSYPYAITNSFGYYVDTPGLELPNGNEYVQCEDSDSFEMGLMFQPTNGIPIPLRAVNWSWSGAATNDYGITWQLKQGTNSINPPDFPTINFPQWNSNVTNYQVLPPVNEN